MESTFKKKFKTKPTPELLEIINSSEYQTAAINAATGLIKERGEQELLKFTKPDFSNLKLDELLKYLNRYQYNYNLTSRSILIYKNQYSRLSGTILFSLGVICLVSILLNWWNGNTSLLVHFAISFSIFAILVGWSRLRTSNYSYLMVNDSGISLKKSNGNLNQEVTISNSDLDKFSLRTYSKSVSIFLNPQIGQPLSALNLQLNSFDSTTEFANELTRRLNEFAKSLDINH